MCVVFGRGNKDDRCSELELSAVQAMASVLCCGPVFDPTGLNDDGYIYSWLDTLLGAHDEKVGVVLHIVTLSVCLLMVNEQLSKMVKS